MKNYKFLGILIVIFVLLGIPLGLFMTKQYIYFSNIRESYDREITLAEDIILDDELTVFLYGNPVILNKGDKGYIHDEINSVLGDEAGEAYIDARFSIGDGDSITVFISTDIESDNPPSAPVVDIDSIESSQTIINEYKQSRERYYTKVRNTQILGTALVVVIILVISAVVFLICKKTNGNAKTNSAQPK